MDIIRELDSSTYHNSTTGEFDSTRPAYWPKWKRYLSSLDKLQGCFQSLTDQQVNKLVCCLGDEREGFNRIH